VFDISPSVTYTLVGPPCSPPKPATVWPNPKNWVGWKVGVWGSGPPPPPDGGDGVLTPVNLGPGTTITFNDVNDFVVLSWNGTDWVIIESSGIVVA
jgi:hypothetical protein